ncbi:TPA: hypothetical protein KM314_004142 [Clostridioides difficile]|nr:hypothetical protein [Clostridioides difficile]
MTFEGACLVEQGVKFAIVIVKPHVLNSPNRESRRSEFENVFGRIPIILMCQDFKGTPKYHGRSDIVKFLASIDVERIPWRRYTLVRNP